MDAARKSVFLIPKDCTTSSLAPNRMSRCLNPIVTIKSSIYVSESRFEQKLDRFRKLKSPSQVKVQLYEWLEHPSFGLPHSDLIFYIDLF